MHDRTSWLLSACCRTLPLLLLLLLPRFVTAEDGPFPVTQLPPPLAPWVSWVLDDVPDHACPRVGEEARCIWPGQLRLELDRTGGTFQLVLVADRAAAVPLPGDSNHWPQEVTLDGAPALVLPVDERPTVRVPAGPSRLSGRFLWSRRPDVLAVPAEVALVELSLDGAPVPFPRREEGGVLWLQAEGAESGEGERLDIETSRKITDGIPLQVTTRIVLRVAGRAREVVLGQVLLPNSVPLSLTGDLPARIDGSGSLRLQARAGTWTIELLARVEGSPDALTPPVLPPPWPSYEIWVWEADSALRQVEVTGPTGIDRSRTNLAEDWKGLPAFLVQPGDRFALTTVRRGEPDPPPDQLQLNREIWLDLDGQGYTFQDRFTGTLSRTWRLNLLPPGQLGLVTVVGAQGAGEGQLITADPATGHAGVELRRGNLELTADSRIVNPSRSLQAVGWSLDVLSLDATLHLPAGWELLTATGVDRVRGSWADRWSLFHFLFILLVAAGVGRLAGWRWGGVALVTLALCQGESGAPFVIWLLLLAPLALVRVVRGPRLGPLVRGGWWATAALLAFLVAPFAVDQLQAAFFPSLTTEEVARSFSPLDLVIDNTIGRRKQAVLLPSVFDKEQRGGKYDRWNPTSNQARGGNDNYEANSMLNYQYQQAQTEEASKGGSEYKYGKMRARAALQNDPKAVVQTGPGVPRWTGRTLGLNWSGPVGQRHQLELWLLSPLQTAALAILRALLVLLLAGMLLRVGLRACRQARTTPAGPDGAGQVAAPPRTPPAPSAAAALGLLPLLLCGAIAAVTLPGRPAMAELPDAALLTTLKERMTRPLPCQPHCLSTSRLAIQVAGDRLRLTGEVHAGAPLAWPLPGPAKNWVPREVTVDGQPAVALALGSNGFLLLRLAPGRHEVTAEGPVPAEGLVVLELGDPPHRVTVDAPGWEVEGLRQDGRAESSIQLSRKDQTTRTPPGAEPSGGGGAVSFPPWLEVRRVLDLGMPWLVHTTVRRVSPTGSPVLARVPLLAGESVTESEVRVEGQEAVVALGQEATELSWSSTLPEQPQLTLTAATGRPWSEVWTLRCSPIWRCATDGLAAVRHRQDGAWEPTFRPWPGESLRIDLQRPQGVAGQSVTVEAAELTLIPGQRITEGRLTLQVRSSQGGPRTLDLPEGATVRSLTIGGQPAPLRQQKHQVQIALAPGVQEVELTWQQEQGLTTWQQVPEVRLGGPAANVRVHLTLPRGRWLLWVDGPDWGPAVRFWGYLALVLLAALLFARLPRSPLRWWQWALLGAGLTQLPVLLALAVAAWFFLLAWRGEQEQLGRLRHDALQLLLAAWSGLVLLALVWAIHRGFVRVDMLLAGTEGAGRGLGWYVDRVDGSLPRPWALSLPLPIWQGLMLAWSLWLLWSWRKWLPWAWRALGVGGYWRPLLPWLLELGRRQPSSGGTSPAAAPASSLPPVKSGESGTPAVS